MAFPFQAWLWSGSAFEPASAIPLSDRGFRYGMSVFESFPVRRGIPFFLHPHLERLRAACHATGLIPPPGAIEACEATLTRSPDGFARIYITAGDGAVTGDFDTCRAFLIVEPRDPIPDRVYHRGYDLRLHEPGHVPAFAGLKTGNYWPNLRAFRDGVASHCNETLLFTAEGFLISACMANVFVVENGLLKTPALGTAARPGVMREWVMQREQAVETLLTRAHVESADEIFLTSSWLGVMPVASVAGRPLPARDLSHRLFSAYRKEVGPG